MPIDILANLHNRVYQNYNNNYNLILPDYWDQTVLHIKMLQLLLNNFTVPVVKWCDHMPKSRTIKDQNIAILFIYESEKQLIIEICWTKAS